MTQLHKSINGSLCPTAILLIVTVGSLSSGVLNALFLRSLWTNPHKIAKIWLILTSRHKLVMITAHVTQAAK